MAFNFSLRRVTNSGTYLAEIDGLRFLAILGVFLTHFAKLYSTKNEFNYLDNKKSYAWLFDLLDNGNRGVLLFFMISGFILALPFGRQYLKGGDKVNLRDYYIRRIVRIEPPYIISLLVLFFANVYVVKLDTLHNLLPHFWASVFYTHNIIYGRSTLPIISPVAWSLEVEVQFYLIAPLLSRIFLLHPFLRRSIFILTAFLSSVLFNGIITFSFRSLVDYIPYFSLGFLLTDLYLSDWCKLNGKWWHFMLLFVLFCVMVCLPNESLLYGKPTINFRDVLLPWAMFGFFYLVLSDRIIKGWLSFGVIPVIGGMCYSIYLIHLSTMSIMGKWTLGHKITSYFMGDFVVQMLVMFFATLVTGTLFYVIIEHPFMQRR